jgi:hypothetical protein
MKVGSHAILVKLYSMLFQNTLMHLIEVKTPILHFFNVKLKMSSVTAISLINSPDFHSSVSLKTDPIQKN